MSLFYFLLFAVANDDTQELNWISWPFNEKRDQICVNQVNQDGILYKYSLTNQYIACREPEISKHAKFRGHYSLHDLLEVPFAKVIARLQADREEFGGQRKHNQQFAGKSRTSWKLNPQRPLSVTQKKRMLHLQFWSITRRFGRVAMCTERQRESTPKKERERARPSERASEQARGEWRRTQIGAGGSHREPAAATGSRRRGGSCCGLGFWCVEVWPGGMNVSCDKWEKCEKCELNAFRKLVEMLLFFFFFSFLWEVWVCVAAVGGRNWNFNFKFWWVFGE